MAKHTNYQKKAGDFLQSSPHASLQPLFSKLRELASISTHIKEILGEPLSQYCQVANIYGSRLVLIAANGSVATQIRFQTEALLKAIKKVPGLAHIREIHCKVKPIEASFLERPEKPKQKVALLSPKTAAILSDTANSISDPKLRAALERIAKRVEEINEPNLS